MKQRFLCILLACGALTCLQAQNRGNFAWWNSEIASNLNLSDAQRREIRETITTYRPRLIDARADVQKAEGELQDILNNAHIDMREAVPVIEHLASARAESTRVFTEMSLKLRSVLTQDQWRELVKRWGTLRRGQRPGDATSEP